MSETNKVFATNLRCKCPIESCTTEVLSAEWLGHLFKMHVPNVIKSINIQSPGVYDHMVLKLKDLDYEQTYVARLILRPVRKSLAVGIKHVPVLLCMRKLVKLAHNLPEDWNRDYYLFWLVGTFNLDRMWAHVLMGEPADTTKQPIVLPVHSIEENQDPEHFEANELLALSQDEVDLWQHEDELKISLAIME